MNRFLRLIGTLCCLSVGIATAETSSPVPPRADGRVLHVDFENYTDGVVQALNAGVRWLGDPFSGRKEGDVAITKEDAYSGSRAARVATRESDEIGRVRLQARYDAPEIDGDSVNEFVFRGSGRAMDDFVLWSARSADGRRAGVTLLAVADDKTRFADRPTTAWKRRVQHAIIWALFPLLS